MKFVVPEHHTAHDVGFVVPYDRIKESKMKIKREILTSGEKTALEFTDEFFKYPYTDKGQIKNEEKSNRKKWLKKITRYCRSRR